MSIMTEENNATPEAIEEVVESTESTDEGTNSTKEVDEVSKQLEADLAKEREAREKAEAKLAENAFKQRDKKRKVGDEEEGEEKPLTQKQLQEILANERETTRKELSEQQSVKLIESYTDNATERELISEIHKNRSFPAHLSLEEQIEESYLIANKKKIIGENSELKRTLKNKNNVSKGSQGTHHTSPESNNEPAIEAGDKAEMLRLGYKWDNSKRLYSKKLSNGNLLTKRSISGSAQIVKA